MEEINRDKSLYFNNGEKVNLELLEKMPQMNLKQITKVNTTGVKKVFYPMNRFFFGHHLIYGQSGVLSASYW